MKNYYILLAAIVLIFSSCEKLKDLADVEIESTFSADIPVATMQQAKGDIGTDPVGAYPIEGTIPLSLDSDDKVADYIDLVKSIQLRGYTMKTVGLDEKNVINLTIMINDVQMFSESGITSTSVFDESSISQAAIDELTSGLKKDKMVTFTVSGDATMPAIFTISQLFETVITANPL